MRTEDKFQVAWNRVTDFLNRHNKPIWLIADGDNYHISVVKPNKDTIAYGTSAVQYEKENGEIIETARVNNF